MKRLFFLLLGALVLVACNREPEPVKSSEDKPAEQTGVESPEQKTSYVEGKGLRLSDDVLKSQGVTFGTVEARELTPQTIVNGQIYRAASELPSRFGHEKEGCAYATASIDSAQADQVKVGQKVTFSQGTENGTIWRIERIQTSATGKVELLIELPDKEARLSVGSFLPITLDATGSSRRALVIPASALLKTATGNFVYAKNGEYLLRKPVRVGSIVGDAVEITEGLSPGEIIVTTPVQTIYLIELRAVSGGGEE